MRRHSTPLSLATLLITLALGSAARAADDFSCLPKRLNFGDTLVISMPTPHGGDLGVWTPKREFLFLVFWASDATEAALSLRNWESFKTEPDLRLNTATSRAALWEGQRPRQLIFSSPGWYRFVLDDKLETEGTPKFGCRVYFTGHRAGS
jgi:hypothetical protein